jgi:hydrogenase nickel incorporation protein HypB
MCATCGCSTHDHGSTPGHPHAHDHDHEHARDHPHTHTSDDGAHRLRTLERDVLARNQALAERNRGWLAGRGAFAINLMSSPGAGKTTLLERTIREIAATVDVAVIEGDQATARDADRIRAAGARAVQINTGTGCHLDAAMVGRALSELDPQRGALVAIENVGNLVCPALFDLGEHKRVVVVSVTEGGDKPIKYPHMFHAADLLILNKVDLLPYVQFDVARCIALAHEVNARLQVVEVSATRGDGLATWYDWLLSAAHAHRADVLAAS